MCVTHMFIFTCSTACDVESLIVSFTSSLPYRCLRFSSVTGRSVLTVPGLLDRSSKSPMPIKKILRHPHPEILQLLSLIAFPVLAQLLYNEMVLRYLGLVPSHTSSSIKLSLWRSDYPFRSETVDVKGGLRCSCYALSVNR